MAESENGAYEPGTYVKGDIARTAKTPAEAVKLVWEGYKRVAEPEAAPVEDKPADETVAEPESAPETEKRGPGRPRKPSEESK